VHQEGLKRGLIYIEGRRTMINFLRGRQFVFLPLKLAGSSGGPEGNRDAPLGERP
jgi:hypothetical protein